MIGLNKLVGQVDDRGSTIVRMSEVKLRYQISLLRGNFIGTENKIEVINFILESIGERRSQGNLDGRRRTDDAYWGYPGDRRKSDTNDDS